MTKEEVDAAIVTLENWGRSVDTWVLICAVFVALFLAAEAALGVAHWLNEKQLRPLRESQAVFREKELVALGKAADEAKERAAKAELALEQFKAPRPMTPDLRRRLIEDVLPLLPKDRMPAVGAVPATRNNLEFAAQIASIIGVPLGQAAAEFQVGPQRGVVAAYVTLNERGKKIAEAFAKALNDSGISAAAVPGLMENLFHPRPNGSAPMDPTEPGQSWVVVVVGDKP